MTRKRSNPPVTVQIDPRARRETSAPGVCRIGPHDQPSSSTVEARTNRRLRLPESVGDFHVTHHVERLCRSICQRVDALSHVDMSRVLVTVRRCRNARKWGYQAKLTPLRFADGRRETVRRGYVYRVQDIRLGDRSMLYVFSLYLPRFLNQTFDEKLVTVFHELFHVHPAFNGDIRRFDGNRPFHRSTQRAYDLTMAHFAKEYLASRPDPGDYDFLRLDSAALSARYGRVVGLMIESPKLIPIRPAE